jgi:hypothetical protein
VWEYVEGVGTSWKASCDSNFFGGVASVAFSERVPISRSMVGCAQKKSGSPGRHARDQSFTAPLVVSVMKTR